MLLIDYETNLMITWLASFVICVADRATTFAITDTKFYVSLVTLSSQDNTKLLEQLKSEFRRRVNWIRYRSKVSTQTQNQYLDYLIDPSFQKNRLFML